MIIVDKSGNVLQSETKRFRGLNLATNVSLFKTGPDSVNILSFVIQFIWKKQGTEEFIQVYRWRDRNGHNSVHSSS